MLLRWEPAAKGPGRCGGGGLGVLEPLLSESEGRLGDERVGFIEDGGVMELWEVSMVEDDLPATISTFVVGVLASPPLKFALERRRSCLRNGMVESWPLEWYEKAKMSFSLGEL